MQHLTPFQVLHSEFAIGQRTAEGYMRQVLPLLLNLNVAVVAVRDLSLIHISEPTRH